MKTFSNYLKEAYSFRLGGSSKNGFREMKYFPKTKEELLEIIKNIEKENKSEDLIDLNEIDVSAITDMSGLFGQSNFSLSMLHDFEISYWDTSNVTDMHYMFAGNTKFNGDISDWDVSNVKSMSNMFMDADLFNQNIGNWDVSSVTTMREMFYYAKSFNQNLSKWDVSNCKDFSSMFQYARNMRQHFAWNIKTLKTTGMCWDTPCQIDIIRDK